MRVLQPSKLKAIFIIAISAISNAQADGQDKSVIGNWKLTKVLDSSTITALDDEQAEHLIGEVFSIEANRIRLGDRTCDNPNFEVTVAETKEFFLRQAHASATKLGLTNPVTAVHVDCTFVYKKPPDRLVVHWKGYFFDAVRQR